MPVSETAIVNGVARDERRPFRAAAESYGRDVRIMIEAPEFDDNAIRLQARCAFRFARLAMEEMNG